MKRNDPDYMLVRVADYDPKWPEMFEAEAALVREIIGDNLITIFHIGSTAVPGLKAKPVIDMLPVVRDVAALDGLTREFAAAGYEAMGEFGLPGRRYFRKGGANRTHQLHAYQYDAVHAITRHVAYRDYIARPRRSARGLRRAQGVARLPLPGRHRRILRRQGRVRQGVRAARADMALAEACGGADRLT